MAAFLTVERQQNTVKSLEELNRQSKITYTVLRDSPYLEYFQVTLPPPHYGVGAPVLLWLQNMKSAEEDLYSKWKEMTLNSGGEETK